MEQHEEGVPPVEEDHPGRRYPSTIGGALYMVMMAVIVAAVVVVAVSSWRVGIWIFAAALVGGALLRLVLNEKDAGMFAVRSKPVDAGLYLLVGGTLAVLAAVIPDQPV